MSPVTVIVVMKQANKARHIKQNNMAGYHYSNREALQSWLSKETATDTESYKCHTNIIQGN